MSFLKKKSVQKVVSLNIDLISYSEAVEQIVDWARKCAPAYICFANVHMVIEAYNNPSLAEMINNSSLVLPDGVPIARGLNFLYGCEQERIAGMDVFPDLLKEAHLNNLRVFFFGTTPETLRKIVDRARNEFPGMTIAGTFSPPFDKSLDDESYLEIIQASKPHMVFVALGCPKQEKWMAKHFQKIHAPMLGVGGAFPVYAKEVSRAPQFMQSMGLEWLYRLIQEPNRLFRRYMITNSMFIWLILKTRFRWSR